MNDPFGRLIDLVPRIDVSSKMQNVFKICK
jgi:hypothetical protein